MSSCSFASRIVISASSGIGSAVASHWLARGHRVVGTYRTCSNEANKLTSAGAVLFECDFARENSVDEAARALLAVSGHWETLAFFPATMTPIQPFDSCDFDLWNHSFHVNFLNQMRILHKLLPARAKSVSLGSLVVFCAGSGSNSAPRNLSAYTLSKIALTKMCEILDSEMPDIRSVILGPGWVKTRIHQEVISAGPAAGEGYERTLERFQANDFVPVERVLACLDWLETQPRATIGGRNISVPNDPWGGAELAEELTRDDSMYKLRRHRNAWKP